MADSKMCEINTMDYSPEKKLMAGKWYSSDAQFDHVYPRRIQQLASRHWTPLSVARKVAAFLAAEKNVKILDIGSGVGKYCLAAGFYHPNASYYGVEQRKDLVAHAENAKTILGLKNVKFLNGNFTQLNLKKYNHFYFFNSFYENLSGSPKIDNKIAYSNELFNYYNRYLYRQLEQMPNGTRVATFHSLEEEIPSCYYVVKTHFDGLVKCWIKV
jgi:hypothetical protein